jgi:alcohol dehydrogenase, propanol-preferring
MAPQSNVADLTKSVRGAAHQLVAWQWPAQVRDVRKPEPGPGEVLLRVGGAGLCRSDLHAMRWPAGALPYELPFTLGHEVSGTVATLGEGTDGIDAAEAEQGRSDVNSP